MSSQSASKYYRTILKRFREMPTLKQKDSVMRKHIVEKFNVGRLETDKTKIASLLASAHQYSTLLSNVHELKYLRGLDSGEKLDPRDKIRATAGRVGLGVPNFADEASFDARAGAASTFSS